MNASGRAAGDDDRLAALRGYQILDTPPEPALDELTELAAALCAAPSAAIAIVDDTRQWFKSRVGWNLTQTRRDVAFCAHVLDQGSPLVVPDATRDPRFADNPLVTGEPAIRFYAGAPLTTPEGHVLGALCVMDRVPRELTDSQLRGLAALGRQVMVQLEMRRQTSELRERESRLQESEERFSKIFYASPAALFIARLRDGAIFDVNDAFERMTGHLRARCLGRTVAELGLITEDAREAFRTLLTSAGSLFATGVPFRNSSGEERIAIGSAELIPLRDETHVIVTIIDATELKRAETAVRESEERLQLALDAAHMGTYDWDLTSGRITWSRGHEVLWGLEPGTFGGTYAAFAERVHADDLGLVNAEVERCLAAHQPFEREFRVVWPDASIHWTLARGEFDYDNTGAAVRLRGVVQDTTARKIAEMALRENERRFEEAQRLAGIGSWRYLPDGTLIWSDQMYELMPVPRGVPLTYQEVVEVIHPDDRSNGGGTAAFRQALASGAREYETDLRVMWPDGRVRVVHSRGTFLRNEHGSLIEALGTAEDVTDRRLAESRIRQLNRVYAMLGGISEAIVRENDQQSVLTAACRITVETGGFRMAWIGMYDDSRQLQIAAHAGADPGVLEVIKGLIEGDPPAGCTFTADALRMARHAICDDIAADPATAAWRHEALARGYRSMAALPLVSLGQTIGVFNIYSGDARAFDPQELRLLDDVATDISLAIEIQRRDAERRRAEERFRLVVETIQEVFWLSDSMGQMQFVSPAYEAVWGRSVTRLFESPASWFESIHPEDRPRMEQSFRSQLYTGSSDETYRIIRPDGSIRWIRARAFPVRNAAGALVHIVGTAADITDQRLLEEQFRQAQKMESVGRLAGGIAHDFNNLLTVINGTAELAALDLPPDATLRGDLLQIRQAGERAATLTRQLLALSRQQILKPAIINLTAVVHGMQSMLRRLIGEHVELAFALSDSVGHVKADPSQIEQVILNLAVNAQDAMPDGGTLTIATAAVDLDAGDAVSHLATRPGPHVMLAISDTGIGMDEATRERIFEPFFTTKELGKGTGLGLSTVYGIVQQSDGGLYVYSEPGRGTTFTIYLPRVDEGLTSVPAIDPHDGAGTETLLVVEDEAALRTLARRILESAGYTVIEASSGNEALAVLAEHEGPVHLMLTDVVMPGMSGPELARRVFALWPDMKVLYASGYTDDAIFRHGVLDAGSRFISKPFAPGELCRKIREIIDS
jgi:two-component system, cell cycle sensor histidine kinase and response regulator CckA